MNVNDLVLVQVLVDLEVQLILLQLTENIGFIKRITGVLFLKITPPPRLKIFCNSRVLFAKLGK